MSTPDIVGNGVDHTGAADMPAIAGISGPIDTRKSLRGHADATLRDGVTHGQIVEPPIDREVIWQFSLIGTAGREQALEWSEQAFRAANRSPATQNDVRLLKIREAEETLELIKDNFNGHDKVEIVIAPDQSGRRRDRHQQAMLWTSYGCIAAGFFVLNFTLSSYLLGSGMLDYVDHPWKTYAFSSLPITAAITLKATAIWLKEETRRRYALGLGVIGGVVAALAWAGSFAWLFSPQTTTSALTLPDDDGVSFDKWIRAALVFMHIIGETGCAAALGLWAHKLSLKNCVTEARMTREFELGRTETQKVLAELEQLQAEQSDETAYRDTFEAGLKAFILKVGARYDTELKRREAQQAAATAHVLSASS
jgi:hypothetical protein